MIGCGEAGALIERRLDGVASRRDDLLLDAHLATCPGCAALLVQETAVDAALAAHFRGAEPSAAFAAGVRARIGDERRAAAPAVAGWLPHVLNAAGGLLCLGISMPAAASWGGATGAAFGATALAVGLYSLLLAAWAGAGPGELDPAP